MYKIPKRQKSQIKINNSVEGETIEKKVDRITENKEPIKDSVAMIYTERKDGVMAGYDIRTDRFEVAIDAMDKASKSIQAKREERAKMNIVKDSPEPNGGEPTDGSGTHS